MITLELPLPPTINHYYGQRHRGGRFIKPAGIKFRQEVADIVAQAGHDTLEGRICLFIAIYPPDRRKRDIDNVLKAGNDALTHAGAWVDDSQIDDLRIVRREIIKGGKIVVVITEIE